MTNAPIASAPDRLGMLTPSWNTALEPLTAALLAGAPHVSAHFARLRVTEIALSEAALGQFDHAPQLAAADLLAEAKVHAIAWNGTAGGWRGFDADRALCAAIAARTGVAATTATLATLDALAAFGARRIAFVTPYLAEAQAAIVRNFGAADFDVVAERHLGDRGNFSFASFGEDVIAAMIREVAAARPDAIVIYCTNFRGTRIAPALEAETDIRIDAVHALLPARLQALADWLATLSMAALGLFMVWVSRDTIADTLSYGSTAPTPWATPLIWPQALWFGALCLFALTAALLGARANWFYVSGQRARLAAEFTPRVAMEELQEELHSGATRRGAS